VAGVAQRADGAVERSHRRLAPPSALGRRALVLEVALVALDAHQPQPPERPQPLGERDGAVRVDPRAVLADVDVEQRVDRSRVRRRQRGVERPGGPGVVDHDRDPLLGMRAHQPGEPRGLGGPHELGGDEHVPEARRQHHLGLAELGDAHAHGARVEEAAGDVRRLGGLEVRAQRDAAAEPVGHAPDVGLEDVEVDDDRGGVERLHPRADRVAHGACSRAAASIAAASCACRGSSRTARSSVSHGSTTAVRIPASRSTIARPQ
jgi:hypothetical protein